MKKICHLLQFLIFEFFLDVSLRLTQNFSKLILIRLFTNNKFFTFISMVKYTSKYIFLNHQNVNLTISNDISKFFNGFKLLFEIFLHFYFQTITNYDMATKTTFFLTGFQPIFLPNRLFNFHRNDVPNRPKIAPKIIFDRVLVKQNPIIIMIHNWFPKLY